MSHVTLKEPDQADQQIRSIPALRLAAARCGLVFKEGQNTFQSWASDNGRLVGDHPVPEGFTEAELVSGICEHAIGLPADEVKKKNLGHYEIGVVKSRKHPGTYSLMYDYFGGALDAKAGEGLQDLQMFYQVEVAREVAARRGHRVTETKQQDGSITCRIRVAN